MWGPLEVPQKGVDQRHFLTLPCLFLQGPMGSCGTGDVGDIQDLGNDWT